MGLSAVPLSVASAPILMFSQSLPADKLYEKEWPASVSTSTLYLDATIVASRISVLSQFDMRSAVMLCVNTL